MGKRLLELYRHRTLIGVLTERELKARYRGSILGFLWSLLNPLLMLVVYTVVFQLILPNRSPATRPYAIFLFCGLLPWNWLSASLSDAASSLLTGGALLKKVLFPAEVLPAVAVLSQGVHFLLALPILLVALTAGILGMFPNPVPIGLPILQVPLLMLFQAIFLFGLGLFLSALTVHFRDVRDMLSTALSLWFFATPILYALPEIQGGTLLKILALNPAAPLFQGWRDALFYSRWVPAPLWALIATIAVATFLVGYAFFDRLRDSFPEAV